MSGATCTCSSGKYMNGSSCSSCTSPCATCSGSATNCSTCSGSNRTPPTCACDTGYYNNSGTCTTCPNPCSACSSATVCSTCKDALMTIVSGMCTCPNGTWNNN